MFKLGNNCGFGLTIGQTSLPHSFNKNTGMMEEVFGEEKINEPRNMNT